MSRRRAAGFSVVELMVAMTLSLIMLGGMLAVVASSRITYGENERVARLQESGRAATEFILRDLRASGYRGCAQAVPFRNLLNDANTLLWDMGVPLQGFDAQGSGVWAPALDPLVDSPEDGSDIIAVRTIRNGARSFRTNTPMANATDTLEVDDPADIDLPVGRVLLASDCNAAAVFAVSDFVDAGTTATIEREISGPTAGVGPGNASENMVIALGEDAEVAEMDTVIYYVRQSDSGNGPALWRIVGAGDPEEIVNGVEGLQLLYGEDTDGDRLVNEYRTADTVGDFRRVIAVSLAILLRSEQPNSQIVDERTYDLLGETLGPFNDRFQRTLYTTTVTLRNQTD
jgi:type IV pilus assembly protein PilW